MQQGNKFVCGIVHLFLTHKHTLSIGVYSVATPRIDVRCGVHLIKPKVNFAH